MDDPSSPQSSGVVGKWSQLKGTRRLFQGTRNNGMRNYPPSCWPTEYLPMRRQARHLPATYSGGRYICTVTCSGLFPASSSLWPMTSLTLWIGWHPLLCLSTPVRGIQQNECLLWPPGQFHGIPGRRQSLAVPRNLSHRKVTSASDISGGPMKDITQINDVVHWS